MFDYKVVALGLARLNMVSELSYKKIFFSGGETCEGLRNRHLRAYIYAPGSQRVNANSRIIFFASNHHFGVSEVP